jgi:hypothetical protein
LHTIDLTEPLLKLDRARAHIDTLDREIESFLARDPEPFGFSVHEESNTGHVRQYLLTARIRDNPPALWGVIIGDAVHNLRSSLDYLAWLMTPEKHRSHQTSFPISTAVSDFQGSPAEKRLACLLPDHRAIIENVQPYHAPHPDSDLLAILKRLSNQDKHRLLVTLVSSSEVTYVAENNAVVSFTYSNEGPLEDGTPIARYVAERRSESVDMDVKPGVKFQIALEQAPRARVTGLLRSIEQHIRGWVIGIYFVERQGPPPPLSK